MRPVHEPPEVVPFVHAAHGEAIPDTNRDAFGETEVVRDQQRLTMTDIDDEPLVRRVVIIGQKAADEACDFDPPPVVALGVLQTSSR